MPSILFVCTANQFRSPIAASCLKQMLNQEYPGDNWIVESAGTWAEAGLPAPGFALQTSQKLGLPGLDKHVTRQVDKNLLDRFDLVIVMEAGHKEALVNEFPTLRGRVWLLTEIVTGIPYNIADPTDPDADPDQVAAEIQVLIMKGAERILQLAKSQRNTEPISERRQSS
jgi:protein-tyrosine phosphatase